MSLPFYFVLKSFILVRCECADCIYENLLTITKVIEKKNPELIKEIDKENAEAPHAANNDFMETDNLE